MRNLKSHLTIWKRKTEEIHFHIRVSLQSPILPIGYKNESFYTKSLIDSIHKSRSRSFNQLTPSSMDNSIHSHEVSPRVCANRDQPARLLCSACKETPEYEDQTTWYCSQTCQHTHWASHKLQCKMFQSRKMLYRAGSFLQEAFYMYREKVFDKLIIRVVA